MRKLYYTLLLAIVALAMAFQADAYKLTIEWNVADAIDIRLGALNADSEQLDPGALSYVFEETTSKYIYAVAKPGYYIKSIEGPVALTPQMNTTSLLNSSGSFWSKYCSDGSLSTWGTDPVVKLNVVPIERTSEISMQIENGAAYVEAYFNSNYRPELQNGANTVKYDPAFDGKLTLGPKTGTPFPAGQTFFYSLTVNGVEKKPAYSWKNTVDIDPVNPGDQIVIKVFENGEPVINYCDLTLEMHQNMAGCIRSIRDWTVGEFLDTSLTTWNLREGTDIAFNFNEDFTFTKFTYAGKDITDKFNASYNQLRFKVEESGTLMVEGAPKDYGTVTFTAYLMNPEGIILTPEQWDGDPADLGEGTAVDADVVLNGMTLEAASSKKYELTAGGKTPYVFISPKTGWYIATAQAKENGKLDYIQYADGEQGVTTFYVIARRLENNAKVNVNVQGNAEMVYVRGNQTLAGMWDNPARNFPLHNGEQTVSFCDGYDNPFNVRAYCESVSATPQMFLDGTALTPDDNGIFSVSPYIQPETQDPTVLSTLTINNSGTPLKTYKVKFTATDIEATLYYGAPHTQGKSGISLLSGTECFFKPASRACKITVDGTVVHGPAADGNYIDGLDADGEYRFAVPEKAVNITVEPAALSLYTLSPNPSAKVNSLASVTVTFNIAAAVEYADKPIELTGPQFATSTDIVYVDDNVAEILFSDMPGIEGQYELTIPAGAFTLDGAASPLIQAVYDFEPVYALTPAPGSEIETADEFFISFPSATNVAFTGSQWSIMLSQDNGYAAPGMDCVKVDADVPTFRISLPEGADQPPLGPLTLFIDEAAFSIDGADSPMIKAEYTLKHDVSLTWQVSPENNLLITDWGVMWTFIFDESSNVSIKDRSKIHVALDGADITADLGAEGIMTESNMLMMMISDTSILSDGMKLKVTLDAGAILIGTQENPAIDHEWTVVAPKEYTAVVDPADGATVNDLSEITVSFPEAETGVVYNEYGFSLRTSNYSYSQTPTVTAVEGAEHPTFKLTFSPAPATDGTYILNLYTGAITLDGVQESPAVTATYNFASVSAIKGLGFDADEIVTVVSVDGKVLYNNVKSADIGTLDKGVYIINGRKMLIK